ncbi:MAG: ComF family protein [Cyclobacteriaceae bacterium]|nr:ComF family protein [Cyclobacteriaceae bacterium]
MSSIRIKSNVINQAFDLGHDFVSLFFPNYCMGCSLALFKGEEILCTRCIRDLPKTGYHTQEDNPIKLRLTGRLQINHAMAFLKFRKTGIVYHLLHQLKYNNHPEIGVRLGKIYGKDLRDSGLNDQFDLIVPVPLHPTRKRKRGYNQSACFAEGLSSVLNIPWDESITTRKVFTQTQTRKTKVERWENVKEVFAVLQAEKIKDARILLVDDVMTTGATLEACGRHLVDAGCRALSVACIAEA